MRGRIILSKKGVDSTYGRMSSVILCDEQGNPLKCRMISIPIPSIDDDANEKGYDNTIIDFRKNIGKVSGKDNPDKITYKQLITGLRKSNAVMFEDSKSKNKKKYCLNQISHCHNDPILVDGQWGNLGNDFRATLGQCGIPQAELNNAGICEGDLFLFFGRYSFAKKDGKGNYKYFTSTEYKSNFHAVWGYMEVDKIIVKDYPSNIKNPRKNGFIKFDDLENQADSIKKSAKLNPHSSNKYKEQNYNTIYVAKKELSKHWYENQDELKDSKFPGFGVFSFCEDCILTAENQNMSIWKFDNDVSISGKIANQKDNKFQMYGMHQECIVNDDETSMKKVKDMFVKNLEAN